MSLLDTWVHTPAAAALGWTLAHSLWEGALVALVLAAALCVLRSSRARYAASCVALLAMLCAFGVTFARLLPASIHSAAGANALRLPPIPDGFDAPWSVANAGGAARYLPWLAPFWIAGVFLFHLRSLLSWMATRRLSRTGVCCPPDGWQERLDGLRTRLRFSRPVALLESCLADVPVVLGYLRPVILMPVGLIAGMSPGQVEAILLHELAHIRRHDYLVNLLQVFVEGLVFYHPAVWWISGAIRAERENCCDDLVVSVRGGAYEYAAALAALEQRRWPGRETALAATGGNLVKRVRRLLAQPEGPRAALSPIFSAAILTMTAVAAMAAWQTKPVPKPALRAPEPSASTLPVPAAPAPKPPVKLLAQARPAPAAEPVSPYKMWLNQDVAYIVIDEERAAFNNLQTDQEREHFIEQFWQRRDPTPATVENEFKEEHYRRIAYANELFTSKIPGWKTDRGRIYIMYGPPDEKETHPSGGAYRRPAEQGGGAITTYPFEQWMYHFIAGIGNNIVIEFVDPTMTGEYRQTVDPMDKDALRLIGPPPGPNATKAGASVQARGKGGASLSIPMSDYRDHRVDLFARILTMTGKQVTTFEDSVQNPQPLYTRFVALPAGVYQFEVVVKDATSGKVATDRVTFEIQ